MGIKLKFAPFYVDRPVAGDPTRAEAPVQPKPRVIPLHEVALSDQFSNRTKNESSRSGDAAPEKSRTEQLKQLFEAIVQYANQDNFSRAQQLYDRLVMEFPSAIAVITKAGEFIEQKKKTAMDPEKIRPWADLFNQFTAAEASAFYYALKEFVVKPNQPVFQQGSCDTRLYFIGSGQLKLKYFDYNIRKNVTITHLGRGDIAGIETFFTLTNHTTNLVAVEESQILFLEKSDYHTLLLRHAAMESKLFKFCESKQARYQQKQPENMSRRAYERYKTELHAVVRRLDQNDRPGVEYHEAKIVDISAGGVGYRVDHLKIGEAACLHNSRILIAATYAKYGLRHELKKTGKVVSLKFHPMGECSVHVQFDEPLDEERVIEIAQHADVIAYI